MNRTEVPGDAVIMNQEPFVPIVPIRSFRDEGEVVAQANATPYTNLRGLRLTGGIPKGAKL